MVNISKNLSNDYSVPVFKTLKKETEFETRFYEKNRYIVYKYKNVESKSDGKNESDDHMAKNVWRLIKYTQGDNDRKENMKFCMPVLVQIERIMKTSNNSQDCIENEIKIMVSLPPEYQTDEFQPPKPNDSELFIEVIEGFECYVKSFSGYANGNVYLAERENLRDILKKIGIETDNSKFICISYDPPYKAFNRRNEVIVLQA
ncbi:unnamed protein product [Brachionus calyciflorus]|uniref:Uncharacterized protein n=1 Tax=Brachionus calyciflorus TaxID=104777 RepID=A0A813V458_9BILA|nr:unnamed protein product [Brachionus calyciflorus]